MSKKAKWIFSLGQKTEKRNGVQKFSTALITKFEECFFWYGKTVGKNPYLAILFCLTITVCCTAGIFNFTKENRPFKLWIPQDSDFIKVMEWQNENFPQSYRLHMIIYEAENVLDRKVILEIFQLHQSIVNNYRHTNSSNWKSICAKLPTVAMSNIFGRRKRNTDWKQFYRKKREFNLLSFFLSREDHCHILENLPEECMEHSILEIWGYNNVTITSLTNEQIIEDINKATTSAVFGMPSNFSSFLGSIKRDENGLIIQARATRHVFITKVDRKIADAIVDLDDSGLSFPVDSNGYQWEQAFVKTVLDTAETTQNINIFVMAASSFGLVGGSAILGDARLLAIGFFVVFFYVQIMLGKFNLVEQRPVLSLLGITCVWLAVGVSYGICSIVGVPFGPVNNVLPFLLLGLGIDDMFVIVQCWNNLSEKEREANLADRIGYALKHAGVSITVTSLTDFAAFAIGCTTALPALKSFCMYAAVGILAVYFFQATFFVAWFTLDQRRLEDSRQGLFWCIKLKNWTPNKFSQRDLCRSFFKNIFSKILIKKPVKIFIIIFTILLLGVSLRGLLNLHQEFNPIWFLPHSSFLYKFFMKLKEHFPSDGEEGAIYFGNISLIDNLHKIEELSNKLQANKYIGQVDSWFDQYKIHWIEQGYDSSDIGKNPSVFQDQLGNFLFSSYGTKYRIKNFQFAGSLNCTEPAPSVLASSIDFKHKFLFGSNEKIIAMEQVKQLVKSLNFTGYVQPWARIYGVWETDDIIEFELYRNLGMALIVVFIMTLFLLASFTTSLMVLLCVFMTLVDVGAVMHWWGLTIDTVSCVDLVLAVGLCVDYAAHIGHSFMIQEGTRDERVRDALTKIGPAVLNGGFSTVLAFAFLIRSDSHVFLTFFKIFFAVAVYGLFHGLVFLPVLLSLVGPDSYGISAVSIAKQLEYGNSDAETKHVTEETKFITEVDAPIDKQISGTVVQNGNADL